MNKKILFIDKTHPLLFEILIKAGYTCDYFPEYTRSDYLNIIGDYIGVVLRSRIVVDKEFLDKATQLRFIGRVGAGMESIDVDYAESKGIKCFNSPEGNRDAVGEHTLGMLLCLFNKINIADKQIRQGIRNREANRGLEIKGKTVGIIGFGNMGSAFAQRLKGFECKVIAYDKYKEGFGKRHVEEVSLDKIFKLSDIVSLHVPFTEETHYMFNKQFIKYFKKDFYLINTSRGQIVNTEALVDGMKSGKIKGCCLDVIEYESHSFEEFQSDNLPEHYKYLLQAENVILTPHIAGWTEESKYKLAKVLADKIVKHLHKKK